MKKTYSVAAKVHLAEGKLSSKAFPAVAERWLSHASGSGDTASNEILHGRWDGKYSDGSGGT